MLKDRNLIDPMDMTISELDEIFDLAEDMMHDKKKYRHICDGMILATLFYEPSTRTRLSFESAMMRLGGQVIGFSEPSSSSVSKGETLEDTIRIVSGYSDVIALRHPIEGSAHAAEKASTVPLINAGDGGHQHPTQTLTDLLTIKCEKGRFDNLTVGLCGDLKYGRTVHSLLKAMSRYKGIKFVLISPDELRVPQYLIDDYIVPNGIEFEIKHNLEECIPSLDILYMTRIQKERFDDMDQYERLNGFYILDKSKMNHAKEDMIVMHPLPRVNEISVDVDDDKRAVYFKQAEYGMYVRMALIAKLLGVA